jgi:hypothetical protein
MGNTKLQAPHVAVFGTGGKESRAWPCVARDAGRGLIAEFSKPGHGSIWVQRARALHVALAERDHRVTIQIDGDLSFTESMIPALTRACEETRGIVGTLVAKSARGAGLATKPPAGNYNFGKRQLVRTYEGVGSPMAIHRDAYECLWSDGIPSDELGEPAIDERRWYRIYNDQLGTYLTLFHPCVIANGNGQLEDRADDLAFCLRAMVGASIPIHVLIDPTVQVVHYGEHGFTVSDALEEIAAAQAGTGRASTE